MKTMLVKLGIRSTSVGLATRQTKADIIGAALDRDRALRALHFSAGPVGLEGDDPLGGMLPDERYGFAS